MKIVERWCIHYPKTGKLVKINNELHRIQFDDGTTGYAAGTACELMTEDNQDDEHHQEEDDDQEEDNDEEEEDKLEEDDDHAASTTTEVTVQVETVEVPERYVLGDMTTSSVLLDLLAKSIVDLEAGFVIAEWEK